MPQPKMPAAVRRAFEHLNTTELNITDVVFLPCSMWVYFDDEGYTPSFPSWVSTGLLEEAMTAVENQCELPVAFHYTP